MRNSLRKLKTFVLGPRTGMSISSNAPEPELKGDTPRRDASGKPPIKKTGFEIKIDEPDAPPPIGEWRKLPNGDRYRRIGIGRAMGSEMTYDDYDDGQGPGQRRRIREVNNPFAGSRWNWRND